MRNQGPLRKSQESSIETVHRKANLVRPVISLLVLTVASFAGTLAPASAADASDESVTPNIVIIFIDDMGYGDIGPFGAKDYPTPNLDHMAANGRRFTDFLVSSAVCSASRAALMTGCYHQRIGIDGALGPQSEIGIGDDELTLAEICKSRGYATACYGKWHLGHHPRFLPTNHGFDHYYGIPYSNDMWPLHPENVARMKRDPNAKSAWPPLPLLESSAAGEVTVLNADMQPADQKQMTRQFTERATDFIRRNADVPFFVYLPHPMVHVPLYVSPEFEGKSGAGLFGDAVMEVDWSVGQILNTLAELGIDENTLVIFTSDNGPWLSYGDHAGSAGPLREGKGTMFEGGYRVPALMQWKGRIPAGTTCDQLSSTIDLLPTIAGLIGAELPANAIDGKDISSLMFADAGATTPHEYFYCFYAPTSLHAVRTQRWKLHLPHPYRTLAGRHGGTDGQPVAYQAASIELSLFDLSKDVGETTNVAAEHPDVVVELLAAAEKIRNELGDKLSNKAGKAVRPPGKMLADDKRLSW
jgi:arylsulfatase A